MRIRDGAPIDAADLARIYNHYVLHSDATFDTVAVTVDDRRRWVEQFQPDGPHRLLVADDERGTIGYAASLRYRDHPAFARTVEFSIYLDPQATGRGVGTELYAALVDHVRYQPVDVAVAGVALPNERSVALHHRVGFIDVGVFSGYAIKAGRRISSLWLERMISGAGRQAPSERARPSG